MRHTSLWAAARACALLAAVGSTAQAQVRLIGITGNQTNDPTFTPHQEAFWDVDITNITAQHIDVTEVGRVLFSPDTQAIGFNGSSGLLHHVGGGNAYSNNPARDIGGYADDQYMETFVPSDLVPGSAVPPSVAIFNANGPNLPDDPPIVRFGLPAPRPSWVMPEEPRTSSQNTDEFKQQGPNEYHAIRGLAWSNKDNTFYGSDEGGIYKLTAAGDSTFLGTPADIDPKGIAIVDIGGEERLYITAKDSSKLMQVDPATGQQIGDVITLHDPVVAELEVPGVLGLAVHPETGDVYGISKGEDTGPFARELILLNRDPITGEFTGNTTLLGKLDVNLSSIAFTFPVVVNPGQDGDTDDDGDVDLDDLNAVRNNFGTSGSVGSTVGDAFPFDGAVNLDDLNLVRNNFGAVAGSAVPEPSTMVLALAGLAVVGYRVRRK